MIGNVQHKGKNVNWNFPTLEPGSGFYADAKVCILTESVRTYFLPA